jgi:hypothetical protein
MIHTGQERGIEADHGRIVWEPVTQHLIPGERQAVDIDLWRFAMLRQPVRQALPATLRLVMHHGRDERSQARAVHQQIAGVTLSVIDHRIGEREYSPSLHAEYRGCR